MYGKRGLFTVTFNLYSMCSPLVTFDPNKNLIKVIYLDMNCSLTLTLSRRCQLEYFLDSFRIHFFNVNLM